MTESFDPGLLEAAREYFHNKRPVGVFDLEETFEVKRQRDLLLAALEKVEWVGHRGYDGSCPWCKQYVYDGHSADCERQAAIAAATGAS